MEPDPPFNRSPENMEEEYMLQALSFGESFFEGDSVSFNTGMAEGPSPHHVDFSAHFLQSTGRIQGQSSKKNYSSIEEAKLLAGLDGIVAIGDIESEDSKEFRSLDPTKIYPQRDINIQPLFEDHSRIRKASFDDFQMDELISDYARAMKSTLQRDILKKSLKYLRHRVINCDVHRFSQSLLSKAASSVLSFSNILSRLSKNHNEITHEFLVKCVTEFSLEMLSAGLSFFQNEFLPSDENRKASSLINERPSSVSKREMANNGTAPYSLESSLPGFSMNAFQGNPITLNDSSSKGFRNQSENPSDHFTGNNFSIGSQNGTSKMEEAKRSKKNWSEEEMRELSELVSRGLASAEGVKEFSKRHGRSETAVRSKIHKLKTDNRSSGMGKKIGWIERDEVSSASMSLLELKPNTIEEMVMAALRQFPGNMATREEIYTRINDLYNIEATSKNIATTQRSIHQTLCTSSKFYKIKGVFALADSPSRISLGDIGNSGNLEPVPLKKKLQFILSKFQRNSGTLEQIRNEYIRLFEPGIINDQSLVLRCNSSINKALHQSKEFDKSKSKTRYGLKRTQEPVQTLFGLSRMSSGAGGTMEQEFSS